MHVPPALARVCSLAANVHTIAKEVAALDHDVADIDADPDVDMTLHRHTEICLGKLRLRLYGAPNCVNSADELRQDAVPGRVGDPPPVGRNQSIKNSASLGQGLKGSDFVRPHHATVPLDIGSENSDQPSLGIARLCHT
jgi:hypothetical protein